jgi:hypothetical protein
VLILNTELHLAPSVRMCGATPPLHIYLQSVVLNDEDGKFYMPFFGSSVSIKKSIFQRTKRWAKQAFRIKLSEA